MSITSFSNVPYWSICFRVLVPRYLRDGRFHAETRPGTLAAVKASGWRSGRSSAACPLWWLGVLLLPVARQSAVVRAGVAGHRGVEIDGGHRPGFSAFGVSELCSDWLMGAIGRKTTGCAYLRQVLRRRLHSRRAGVPELCQHAQQRLARHGQSLLLIERPVRLVANYTFTLYLLHQPLFLFWGAVCPRRSGRSWFLVHRLCADAAHCGRSRRPPHRKPPLHPARFPVSHDVPPFAGPARGRLPP